MISIQNYAIYTNNLTNKIKQDENALERRISEFPQIASINMLDYLANNSAAISFKAQNLPQEENDNEKLDVDVLSSQVEEEEHLSAWEKLQKSIEETRKRDELRQLYGLPTFFDDSDDESIFNMDNSIFYDYVEEKECVETYNKVTNIAIKDLIAKLYNKCVLQNVDLMFLVEIDSLIADISDEKIQNYVNKALNDICNNVVNDSYAYRSEELWNNNNNGEYKKILSSDLEPILNVIDAYNVITNKYVQYKKLSLLEGNSLAYELADTQEFLREFKEKYPDLTDQLKGSIYNQDKSYWLANEFQNAQKIEAFWAVRDVEFRKYLYSIMIKNMRLSDEEVGKLDEIYSKYNVMIFPSAMGDNLDVLTTIEKELESWKSASNGEAKLPNIINLNTIREKYLGNTIGSADLFENIIHLDFRNKNMKSVLRHELMHINDKRPEPDACKDLLKDIFATKIVEGKKIIDFDRCKYREELLKAGIPIEDIKYAYKNRTEFVAVAAEGEMKRYSPEFKDVLLKLGIPAYVWDLKGLEYDVEHYASSAEEVASDYPDEKDFNNLVCLREKIATERYVRFANLMKAIARGESIESFFSDSFEDLDDEEIDDLENEELD